MISFLLLALLVQSTVLPQRLSLENPSAVTAVPAPIRKDYDALWSRFLAGQNDKKVLADAERLLKKQKGLSPALVVAAYVDLYNGRNSEAEQKFNRVLSSDPGHPIALYYLAELAYARKDYAAAGTLYARLGAVDRSRPEIDTKREKSLLLATGTILNDAGRADAENRFADAEALYRRALVLAPDIPSIYVQLGVLLGREGKWEESLHNLQRALDLGASSEDSLRHIAAALTNLGRTEEARRLLRQGGESSLNDSADLETLGRWGNEVDQFVAIAAARTVSREQFAALAVRYFPQIAELQKSGRVVTDVQDSWARSEVETAVSAGLFEPAPNHTFQPARTLTRLELATTLSRLTRILGLHPVSVTPIPTNDVPSAGPIYQDVQLVLSFGLMSLDSTGTLGVEHPVSGKEAVDTVEKLLHLLRENGG